MGPKMFQIHCFPNIAHLFILGKKKRDDGYGYNSFDECEECGTVEDCFDRDQPCPRYGYIVRYTFTREVKNQGGYGGHGFTERQAGQGFRSGAPADCRVTTG